MPNYQPMERVGHDAPDLRFGLEIVDLSDLAPQSDFGVFKSVVAEGGRVRPTPPPGLPPPIPTACAPR